MYSILVYDFQHIFNGSKSILYEDDSFVYAQYTDPENAIELVKNHHLLIDDFYREWAIKINTVKSEAICFRHASEKGPHDVVRKSKTLDLSLRGSNIHFKDYIKYLVKLK